MSNDIFLASFIPLVILFLIFRVYPTLLWVSLLSLFTPPKATLPLFSRQHAYHSFKRFRSLADAEHTRLNAAYRSLGRAHTRLASQIGYPAKLAQLREATTANARVTDAIARFAASEHDLSEWPQARVNNADLNRVREVLRHFVRDWSSDGVDERQALFRPILDALKPHAGRGKSVLVPGSGLGRLAWEISQLGFNTTAVEISAYMTLAMRLILQPTTSLNAYTIHPYAHGFSHQKSNANTFRSVQFPDVLPRLSGDFKLVEGDFLEQEGKWDFIVTAFFIDTAPNVFATLEHIHTLLAPNGLWVNLGPLLWHTGTAKVQLSLEEVMATVREIGFEMLDGPRTVPCEYTADPEAMMRWVYQAETWTARKKVNGEDDLG
ncbi:N2227-domain-containing protein [Cylindrobasidium torrendii FP15055 ss-10]|uniref:N2227-domain-containing protein n=1 Tax=Cylindrobasidium torrendii FP15055 ss-10 TaxID=1314674 RepID=A0A0D7AXF9_9AGAR|nr:N2227-domain-containing protein [Cylindrobasidium torrendii FP15055 ss-10]